MNPTPAAMEKAKELVKRWNYFLEVGSQIDGDLEKEIDYDLELEHLIAEAIDQARVQGAQIVNKWQGRMLDPEAKAFLMKIYFEIINDSNLKSAPFPSDLEVLDACDKFRLVGDIDGYNHWLKAWHEGKK